MFSVLLTALVAAGDPNVVRAERLYEGARYELALQALGRTCTGMDDVARCERVRALNLIALERFDEARAAFVRMLVADPGGRIGEDVAPKVRRMFDEAEATAQGIAGLALSPVHLEAVNAEWRVETSTALSVKLESLVAYIAPPGTADYKPVDMRETNGIWSGTLKGVPTPSGEASYYLVVVLPGGDEVTVGSQARPVKLPVRVSGDAGGATTIQAQGVGAGGESFQTVDAFALPERPNDQVDSEGLPTWAWWTIGGGGVAVVATVLVLVLAGGGSDKGSVPVVITYQQ